MSDRERMLKAVWETHEKLLEYVDKNYPLEEPEMTPSYAIEYLEKIKTSLEIEIRRYKNSIGFRDGSITVADHELIEKYRTVEYVIELLGRMEE